MEGTQILKVNGLRLTNCRSAVIDVFCTADAAIGHAELEDALVEEEFDRVTIYRTINTFLDKGIIHKVMDGSGVGKFALCSAKCDEHEHHDDHVHFNCLACGNTTCMEDLVVPNIHLPKGYEVKEANLLLKGICLNCKKT
ncbi:MAG: Fur family transcriptional regulator [Chitinophagales bacterium]